VKTCSAATTASSRRFWPSSVAIGVGSALASWLAHGRIVLFPTLLAAVLLGLFALDLSWAMWDVTTTATAGFAEVFRSARGLRVAIDLAGLAIAGGLFIVPSFSAVQAWAGADRRARIVAAVNVLNAAFMTVAGVGVALVQKAGATPAMLFLAIGVANFVVAVVIARTMPTSPLRDFLSVLLRVLYRLEVHGLENVAKAGPHPIIALNHVSFLDAAIALAVLEQDPIFAIDHGIAQRWCEAVSPTDARHAARSDQTDGDAHTHQRGQRRGDADYISRGAHHRNREPDESL
jgi:acyl-[acyl-carrier-protein]-phospholipid O-acyltransferase/long-chain-fatty-acid--[acyl-carrier-protein] ligase